MPLLASTTLRLGLFGVGLDTYWAQFTGLKDHLVAYQTRIAQRLRGYSAEVLDIGLFNGSFKLVRWAQQNNMVSIRTDCPTREKRGWLNQVLFHADTNPDGLDTKMGSQAGNSIPLVISEWKRDGQRVTLHLVVPTNTTATIGVPSVDYSSVREGGRPAMSSLGISFIKVEGSYSPDQTGSGDYTFDATLPASVSN